MIQCISLELSYDDCVLFIDMSSTDNTDNDLLLAQMMQLEFDKEYDDFVKTKEKVFNQNSNG